MVRIDGVSQAIIICDVAGRSGQDISESCCSGDCGLTGGGVIGGVGGGNRARFSAGKRFAVAEIINKSDFNVDGVIELGLSEGVAGTARQ